MKAKHILLAVAALTMSATTLQAKDLQDYRIYINPGHGGWDGGDRHMGTVKHGPATYLDTCGFFETNTNLWKGLATVNRLAEYGFKFDPTLNPFPADFVGYRCNDNLHDIQTNGDPNFRYGAARDMSQGLVMSHVKNGLSRNINEIAIEVEANNFDLFLSIHSNAASEGASTNYPAMFVRGENKTESVPGSCDMARTIWPYAFANTHAQWSNYSMTNPGLYYDIDFWSGDYALTDHGNGNIVKGYYAVLRHNVPGFLMEGYFHTYQPARHRAMNQDVCRIEGEAYARGIAEYLNVPREATGDIYGIVRDMHEKFRHTFYTAPSNSPDAYLPINNANITLLDAAGNTVATYTTDDEYNGAFVFRNLQPGSYTIKVSADEYKDADASYCGPFEVTAATTLFPCVQLEKTNYEPPTAAAADYEDEITSPAINAADSYVFTQAIADRAVPELEGKTVKRFIAKGKNLYVLAHDAQGEPYIYVFDATTLAKLAEVSTAGTEGTVNRLADIQLTADGVLVGSASQLNFISRDYVEEGETYGECNFYKWAKGDNGLPAGDPEKWFGTTATANFFRAVTGFTFAYTGTLDEGKIYLPSYSTYYERKVWLNVLDIIDGEFYGSRFVNQTRDHMNMDELGDDVTATVSPLNSESFIVNSSNVAPMQFSGVDYNLESTAADNHAAHEGYFKFAGTSLMAATSLESDGAHTGVVLHNVSAGLNAMRPVETTNTAIEAGQYASAATAGRTVVEYDADENIASADIDLYVLRGNKLSRFTTAGVDQPAVRGHYAYGLTQSLENEVYTLGFSLTGEADATVGLRNAEGETIDIATGRFDKGANSVTIAAADIPEGDYNWQVTVENPTVPGVATIYNSGIVSSGVAIDRNPESDLFGNVYVSRKDVRQIEAFTPDFEPLEGTPFMKGQWDTSVGASPWRLAVLPTGKLLISDWGDVQGGLYLFNPAEPSQPRTNFFAGTVRPTSGEWTYNGAVIGGSTSGMAVVGSGEETRLISFQEDWPSDYQLNLVYYNIGTRDQITEQPVQPDEFKNVSGVLRNGNVDVIVREQGMLLGQVRGSGNNTKGVPSFVVTDPAGEVLFNSGSDMADLTGSTGLFALNDDASLLLVQDDGNYIHVCAVEWEPEFTLTELYKFNVLEDGGSDTNTYQGAFDPAGNFYVANRSSMRVFSLPRKASQTVTPAKASMVIKGSQSGINDITVDAEAAEGPVQYFNLQGIEVSADNLSSGVYIRRCGNTATKVVVR